jgi:hypothetical protein
MPKTVAVIGASNDRRKFGNRAVRAYQQQGIPSFRSTRTKPPSKG